MTQKRDVLMRVQRGRVGTAFHRREAALHRALHFLEGPHLDLAHALAGNAELRSQLLEPDRMVSEAPAWDGITFSAVPP